MSTIRKFIVNYKWKKVDESWKDRWDFKCFPDSLTKWCHQCGALVKFFCSTVYWTKIGAFGGWVANWYKNNTTFPSSSYSYIEATKVVNNIKKTIIPKRWDIIFFEKDPSNYNYWHIWIVLSATARNIYILEQNAWNWDWFWNWNNAIRISTKSYSNILGYHRYKNIWSKVKEDLFDEIVHEKWIYIWEADNNLKRWDVVKLIFYFLSKYNDNKNWKNYKSLWITTRLNDNTTRQEMAYIILTYLNKILNKNLKIQDIQKLWIWNWQRPNDRLNGYDFTFMVNKTMEIYKLHKKKEELEYF